ncbi:MAG: S-adenosylmethionine:tRNA ribosyltransferase-isomerase, partial [Bacteroidota bacterium]|nr:S-adenosylmethionine:tRNA ribosyltransferase-isomerase [Bacteroidota bacterium]
MHPKELSIDNFNYHLPEEKIAFFPLTERDQSKLLIDKDGIIKASIYRHLANYLPEKSFLVFNDTKVINARILFTKETGAIIEIFCLEPYEEIKDYAVVFQKTNAVRWKCMIGGAGKWKQKYLEKKITINNDEVILTASLLEKLSDAYVVELSW